MPCERGHVTPLISCPACGVWRDEWLTEDQLWVKQGSKTFLGKPVLLIKQPLYTNIYPWWVGKKDEETQADEKKPDTQEGEE